MTPFLDLDSPMTAYEWAKFVAYLPITLIRLCLVILILPHVLVRCSGHSEGHLLALGFCGIVCSPSPPCTWM